MINSIPDVILRELQVTQFNEEGLAPSLAKRIDRRDKRKKLINRVYNLLILAPGRIKLLFKFKPISHEQMSRI